MKACAAQFFLLLMLLSAPLLAQNTVVQVSDQLQEASLAQELMFFRDATGSYSIEQISSPAFADSFQLVRMEHPNFGFLNGVYWFRLQVKQPQDSKEKYYFEVAYPPLDSITYYYQQGNGEWYSQLTGDQLPFDWRNSYFYNYLFELPSTNLLTDRYYFRVATDGALTFPVSIKEVSYLRKEVSFGYFRYGLYYGALVLMLLYNLFLYVSLRLKPYLFYCVYVFFSILSQAYLYGHAQQFLWPYGGELNNLLSGLTLLLGIGFASLFAVYFVDTKQFTPRLHLVLLLLSGIIFVLSIAILVLPYRYVVALIPSVYIVSVVLIIYTTATAWYRGQTTARLFLLAWVVYLLSLLSYSFQSMGLIGSVKVASNFVMVGSVLEALLLSLALADRIRQYRRDRQKANEQVLHALQDKQELMEQQQSVLEKRVGERTARLEQKQKEVLKQNKQLFEQQQLIEQQYQQLSVLNENLERIVGSRTGELRKVNISLHKRNQQLEQFAYIISHNLRGPVASMIGLLKLFDASKVLGVENKQYLALLQQSVLKLDMVIADLGQVLTLEQSLEKYYRDIDVPETVQGILEKLHLQVQKAKPEIELDYGATKLTSHPAYLESILYNLISNAIKYKNPEKDLKIKLSTALEAGYFIITVADNGMGVDLEQYGKRLFSLYQRFHTHTEGKGLGLYMVKRQVEALGGKIEAESKPGEGATFTVSLPLFRE